MKFLKVNLSTTKADLKKQYKLAAQTHHPDKGGSHEDFIKLQKEYDDGLVKISKYAKKKREKKKKWTLTDKELNYMIREFDKLHKMFNGKKRKPQKKKV